MTQPTLYMLIGVPASGKSTYVTTEMNNMDCAYISSDAHIEAYATKQNSTYDQVFREYAPVAMKLIDAEAAAAKAAGCDIIWDQTSLTLGSRRKKFLLLPEYRAIAIVFSTPEHAEHTRRLNSRAGKSIPPFVIDNMIRSFIKPSIVEGFAEIWYR